MKKNTNKIRIDGKDRVYITSADLFNNPHYVTYLKKLAKKLNK